MSQPAGEKAEALLRTVVEKSQKRGRVELLQRAAPSHGARRVPKLGVVLFEKPFLDKTLFRRRQLDPPANFQLPSWQALKEAPPPAPTQAAPKRGAGAGVFGTLVCPCQDEQSAEKELRVFPEIADQTVLYPWLLGLGHHMCQEQIQGHNPNNKTCLETGSCFVKETLTSRKATLCSARRHA